MRTCTVDSGSKTSDVELIRIPHSCGQTTFYNGPHDDKDGPDDEDLLNASDLRIYACINVCYDNGCNLGIQHVINFNLLIAIFVMILL